MKLTELRTKFTVKAEREPTLCRVCDSATEGQVCVSCAPYVMRYTTWYEKHYRPIHGTATADGLLLSVRAIAKSDPRQGECAQCGSIGDMAFDCTRCQGKSKFIDCRDCNAIMPVRFKATWDVPEHLKKFSVEDFAKSGGFKLNEWQKEYVGKFVPPVLTRKKLVNEIFESIDKELEDLVGRRMESDTLSHAAAKVRHALKACAARLPIHVSSIIEGATVHIDEAHQAIRVRFGRNPTELDGKEIIVNLE